MAILGVIFTVNRLNAMHEGVVSNWLCLNKIGCTNKNDNGGLAIITQFL